MKHALTTGTKDLTDRQRRNLGQAQYYARQRDPNEALPQQVNKMAGTYTPPSWPTRERSQDHQAIKSRGF